MRKKLKKLLALAICLVVATSFAANIPGLQNVIQVKASYFKTWYSVTLDEIKWSFYGKNYIDGRPFEVELIEAELLNNTLTDITIPDCAGPYNITYIPKDLFKGNTTIKNVILGDNITYIENYAFNGCSNLLSVKTKSHNNAIKVGVAAFTNCEKLNEVDFKIGYLYANAFSKCTSLKQINDFQGDSIGMECFYESGLEQIHFSDEISSLSIYYDAFKKSQLTSIEIPCDVALYGGAFGSCPNLKTMEFYGNVVCYGKTDNTVFENSFIREYDKDYNLLEKTIVFHSDVEFTDYFSSQDGDFNSNRGGDFLNCTGLSKVVFKGKATVAPYTFRGCENLKDIVFEGDAVLGDSAFLGAVKLKSTMTFKGNVSSSHYPFDGSTITDVNFEPQKEASVNCSFRYRVEKIKYGPLVTSINGTIDESAQVKQIIFLNPNITPNSSYGKYATLNLNDKKTSYHEVYGYSSINPTYRYIEQWASNNSATFSNLVSQQGFEIIDKLKFYGAANKENIDLSNLTVKYICALSKDGEQETISYSKDNRDCNGYVVNTDHLNDVLTPGTYKYPVSYSGNTCWGTIVVEDIVPTQLDVEWDEDYINELVVGQDLSLQDVVSGVAITYNNGDTKTFGKDQLENMSVTSGSSISLVNKKTEKGINTFKIVYKETSEYETETEIETHKDFLIKENYITKISANVSEKERYVGDTVSIDDFEVLATYKYNEDPTVEHKLKPTSVENTVLTVSGSNIVKVNYNTFSENVTVSAIEVCPAKIVAAFDKNNAYIDGQTKYDLDAFNVAVTYNNGDSKDNYEQKNLSLTEDNCVVEELLRTSSEATVILKYTENGVTVESQEIVVPITEKKPTSLNVVSNIDSMVEGSEFDKSNITSIEITYNNGNTEVQDSSLIDYANLSISHDAIVANQKNTITVTYLGVKATIDVVGTAKTVNRIEAVYVGEPIIVGNYFDAADVEFTLYYNNGQSEVISTGFVVKDADRQVVKAGPNEVYVYYDAMYTTITVPGIASDIIPTNTLNPVPTSTTGSGISPTELPLANNEQTMAPAATTTAPTTTETTAPAATTTAPTAATTTAPTATTNIATNNIPGALSTSFNIISNHKLIKLSGDLNSKVFTNKKIEITIDATNANDIQYQIITGKNALSDSGWKNVSGSKITVNKTTKACVIYFRYKDATGNIVNTHTCYFTIDKQKAKVNVKNGKTYKTGFKLKFSDASGINSAKLDGKRIKNNTKITKKGLHKIVVLDAAGNKKIVKFRVQ